MEITFAILMPILTVITIIIEWTRHKYLKERIEGKLTSIKIEESEKDESGYLVDSYKQLQISDLQAFKRAQIDLKILKEKQSDGTLFEEFTKLITIVISLISVMISLTINIYKETQDLKTFFFDPAMDIIWMMLWIIGWLSVLSRIFSFSTSRSKELISIHLIVIEDVGKDPEIVIDKSNVQGSSDQQEKEQP
ncbi:hypothetical protein [Paenibacillus dakarensis]|uniref:hypothetical protein n=1 Tax=Paenibacillus dakarensis TaxID=1527293 RepID=UPI0006D57213|nr:hypothetical protein [Paenibacillus dakarensis]